MRECSKGLRFEYIIVFKIAEQTTLAKKLKFNIYDRIRKIYLYPGKWTPLISDAFMICYKHF